MRELLVAAVRAAGLWEVLDLVALPVKRHRFQRWYGPGRTTWPKHLPGFLFVRVACEDGVFPEAVLELLGAVRGVGAIDTCGGAPRAVAADQAARLEREVAIGYVPGRTRGRTRDRQRQRLVLRFGPGRVRNRR